MKITITRAEIEKYAPLPTGIAQLNKIVFQPKVDESAVAQIIETDPELKANVLTWAKVLGSEEQAAKLSVAEIVLLVGIENIIILAIGKRIANEMRKSQPGYALEKDELWRHSVAAALAAECLVDITNITVPHTAFAAALLHDVGKLLLGKYLTPETVGKIRGITEMDCLSYIEAEEAILGTNHAKVGSEIARFWGFSEDIVLAIEHHHDYEYAQDPLLESVQIANAITKLLGIGMGNEQMNINIHSDVPQRMGLTDTKIEILCMTVSEKLAMTEALWQKLS
jgi:putative nucleotidyltransferase with HDIG domain